MTLAFEQILNIDIDFPAFALSSETWAIESYLSLLEDEIAHARDQYRLRKTRELAKLVEDIDGQEHNDRWQRIEEAADLQIPRFFRNGALISIWGLLESFIEDFARYAYKKEKAALKLRDIYGTDLIDRTIKYYEGVLRIDLGWTETERNQLNQLRLIRNILAHNNGRLEDAPADKVEQAKRLAKTVVGVNFEGATLFVDASYVQESWSLVRSMLTRLKHLLADRYVPPPRQQSPEPCMHRLAAPYQLVSARSSCIN